MWTYFFVKWWGAIYRGICRCTNFLVAYMNKDMLIWKYFRYCFQSRALKELSILEKFSDKFDVTIELCQPVMLWFVIFSIYPITVHYSVLIANTVVWIICSWCYYLKDRKNASCFDLNRLLTLNGLIQHVLYSLTFFAPLQSIASPQWQGLLIYYMQNSV